MAGTALRSVDQPSTNAPIASLLEEVADLLAAQNASPRRVAIYRRTAADVRAQAGAIPEVLARGGISALVPMVGPRLAGTVGEIAAAGRLGMLDILRGEVQLDGLVGSEHWLGGRLARRVRDVLGIVTVAELEIAARDGRLANVRGFGGRRVAAIHDRFMARFGRVRSGVAIVPMIRVPVEELLDVDRQYRDDMIAERLPRSAARDGRAARPILHTARGERWYTATVAPWARLPVPGGTDDGVFLHVEAPLGTRQATVVTETVGPLAGRRVVRGRERESQATNGVPRRRSYAVR